MHFPQYWARGTAKAGRLATRATGWSDRSVMDALDAARTRAEHVLLALATGEPLDHYAYGARTPLREEIVEHHGKNGESGEAVVTRNRYGSLILNTARVLFADVDDPQHERTSFLAALFGGKPKFDIEMERDAIRRRVEGVVAGRKNLRCALYRTKAGFRLLVLSRLFDPESDETKNLFEDLGADPLYTRLTGNQKCFRARLTPKPWRCGLSMPPYEFPRETEKPELAFLKWRKKYESVIAGYATCEFLGEIGTGEEIPEAAFVRRLHDARSIGAGRPLA
jgi:hypothetical protein